LAILSLVSVGPAKVLAVGTMIHATSLTYYS
jgi:hypothetical protein